MRPTAWWGLLSSAAAPVLLIGGWTVAAARQPAGFDSLTQTISALAARGTPDRWVMTAALAGLGVCHLVTASALRPAATPGRVVLGVGGAATVLVAVLPLPADGGSVAHTVAATVALTSLAAWPAVAAPRGPASSWALSSRTGAAAAAVLLAGLAWLLVELSTQGDRVGLAERVAAGSQALWPFVVVVATRRGHFGQRSASRTTPGTRQDPARENGRGLKSTVAGRRQSVVRCWGSPPESSWRTSASR